MRSAIAIVRNADHSLTRGLTQADFELREDGKVVPISTFAEVSVDAPASVDDGRFVVLLLDDLGTDPVYTTRIKQIAHGFADRIGPKDVMSVVYLNGSSSVTTQDRGEIKAAIDRMKPFGRSIMSAQGLAEHSIRAVGDLATQLATINHRRKVVVCIGPARLFNPGLEPNDLSGYTGQTVRHTGRADVTAYVIDPLGLTDPRGPRPVEGGAVGPEPGGPSLVSKGIGLQGNLDGFARETGGLSFSNTNIYEPAIAQVWEESGSYYLLGYEPAKRDDKRHNIDVRVNKPGVQVRARRVRG